MIIDCHGHYTTAPKALQSYRDAQIAELKSPSGLREKGSVRISDDEIKASIEGAQLKFQRERGSDVTIWSRVCVRCTPAISSACASCLRLRATRLPTAPRNWNAA